MKSFREFQLVPKFYFSCKYLHGFGTSFDRIIWSFVYWPLRYIDPDSCLIWIQSFGGNLFRKQNNGNSHVYAPNSFQCHVHTWGNTVWFHIAIFYILSLFKHVASQVGLALPVPWSFTNTTPNTVRQTWRSCKGSSSPWKKKITRKWVIMLMIFI